MIKPIIVKIGGSLLQSLDTLRQIGDVLSAYSKTFPLVIIPGGGPFADQVRFYGEKIPLKEETCHFMALLGMEQYAFVLQEMIPNSHVLSLKYGQNPKELVQTGQVAILRITDYMLDVPAAILPRTWEVTSDSLAAFLAQRLNAQLLLLLKAKDIDPELISPDVDPTFQQTIPRDLPVWILNGHHPEYIRELLASRRTQGVSLGPAWKEILRTCSG